ncbi:MAG: hypothetical protein Q7S56_03200 [Nanoarchaeota archaeon]|nr:hypothetical protein [Nanoarchaeota archaeon]
MLLNIIHPYTYHGDGDTFCIGGPEKFDERNKQVREFVLSFGERILIHRFRNGLIEDNIREISLNMDSNFDYIKKLKNITTTQFGIPLPDERPKEISEDKWKYLCGIYSISSEIMNAINGDEDHLFIGGVLENCVTNAMAYFRENYSPEGKILYIPELCVSENGELLSKVEKELDKLKIYPINLEDALFYSKAA